MTTQPSGTTRAATHESRAIATSQSRQQAEERTRAARALLMTPLMTPSNQDFGLVRKHAAYLRDWFAREAGWPLQVERDCARLFKRPADLTDGTRGFVDANNNPFNRNRYVLFCLVCAILVRSDQQTTLRDLSKKLLDSARDPALTERGFDFTMERQEQRRDLVAVCNLLTELGALELVTGDQESFVVNPMDLDVENHDALYDIRRQVLAGIIAAARGPSTWSADQAPTDFSERTASLVHEYVPDTEEARKTASRHHLSRRLLDDPVVYLDSLAGTPHHDYYVNQRGPMAQRLSSLTGLVPEQRAEGLALADDTGQLTDIQLPGNGTHDHVTLLVAEFLGAIFEGLSTPAPVAVGRITDFIVQARSKYSAFWKKSAKEPGSEHELAEVALSRLHKLNLIAVTEDGVLPRPALHRIHIDELEVQEAGRAKPLLLGEGT